RTATASESHDLVGTDAAAAIPATLPGRAFLSRGGSLEPFQVAVASATPSPVVEVADAPEPAPVDLAAAVVQRWSAVARAPRLWAPALPERLELADAPPGDGWWIGRGDDVASREQPDLWWE